MMEPDEPLHSLKRVQKPVLDPLGVAELRDYIEELRAEIVRAEEHIARKTTHRSAADAFFKRPAE